MPIACLILCTVHESRYIILYVFKTARYILVLLKAMPYYNFYKNPPHIDCPGYSNLSITIILRMFWFAIYISMYTINKLSTRSSKVLKNIPTFNIVFMQAILKPTQILPTSKVCVPDIPSFYSLTFFRFSWFFCHVFGSVNSLHAPKIKTICKL